jgi:hypothetical protein
MPSTPYGLQEAITGSASMAFEPPALLPPLSIELPYRSHAATPETAATEGEASMKARLIHLAIALCAAFLLAPVFAQLRDQGAPQSAQGIDLLLIEHTFEGTLERTGSVRHFTYAADPGGAHSVLCVDHVPDGDLVMRDGFDEEIPSCQ